VGIVLVDGLDLATARAVQYGRALSVDELRAVHFVLDPLRAKHIADRWVRLGLSRLPLQLIECQDRRIERAALELVADIAADGETEVSVLLPRRAYGFGLRRVLHDATGERIAAAIGRLDHVNATIVPFDVRGELRQARGDGHSRGKELERAEEKVDEKVLAHVAGTTPIPALQARQKAKVAGRVKSVTVQPWGDTASLQVQLTDDSGTLTVAFLGRRQIPGLVPGSRIVVDGTVAEVRGRLGMINPHYEFVPNSYEGE
jgi:hypothetical protein